MGMAYGLEKGQCSSDDLVRCIKMVPNALEPYVIGKFVIEGSVHLLVLIKSLKVTKKLLQPMFPNSEVNWSISMEKIYEKQEASIHVTLCDLAIYFLCPCIERSGAYCFTVVRPSVCTNLM